MAASSKTATSTPRLSEFAREFVFPKDRIVKTVWPRVEAKGLELGLGFDWWQSQLGTVCLGYGADGKYAATVGGIGLSIPRQVGKTYFVATLLLRRRGAGPTVLVSPLLALMRDQISAAQRAGVRAVAINICFTNRKR